MSLPATQLERIAYLWASGIPQATIAAAVGISAGRLTQLLEADTTLQAAISEAEAANVDKDITRQDKLTAIEDRLLVNLESLADESTSLGESVRALAIINELQRKKRGLAPSTGNGIGIGVQVNLSKIAQESVNVVLSPKGAIISLGETSVTPMSRDRVGRFFDDLDQPEAIPGLAHQDDALDV